MTKFFELVAILLLVAVLVGVIAILYNKRQLNQNRASKKRQKGSAKTAAGGNGTNSKEQQSSKSNKDKGGAKTGRQKLVSSDAGRQKFGTTKPPNFVHPWLASTLKGPTSAILDLDCGANDKLVASCSIDDSRAQCENKRRPSPSTSSSSSSSSNSSWIGKRRNRKGRPPAAATTPPPPPKLSAPPQTSTQLFRHVLTASSPPSSETPPTLPPPPINVNGTTRSANSARPPNAAKRSEQIVVSPRVTERAVKSDKMLCVQPPAQPTAVVAPVAVRPSVPVVPANHNHRHGNNQQQLQQYQNGGRRSSTAKQGHHVKQQLYQYQVMRGPSVGHLNLLNGFCNGQRVGSGVLYQLLRNYILDVGQQILHCFPIEVYGMPGLVFVPERHNPVGGYGVTGKLPPQSSFEDDERSRQCCRCYKQFAAVPLPDPIIPPADIPTITKTKMVKLPHKKRKGRRPPLPPQQQQQPPSAPVYSVPVAVVAPTVVAISGKNNDALSEKLAPADEPCYYHWGKLHTTHRECERTVYSCCFQSEKSAGCTMGASHVRRGQVDGYLHGFVKTRPTVPPFDGNYGVCALDCEMCYTSAGLQVARVTLLRLDGEVLYETMVKPDSPIVDYNTRFSGLTAEDMVGAWRTIYDVQQDLLSLLNADTILIGHGLENDMCALRLLHRTVIDTSALFPHNYGLPYRRSLRSLASLYLHREIQTSETGHDSYEDAKACLDLVMWRLRQDVMRDL